MAAIVKDLAQVNADLQEQKERIDTVDFKMITFSLGGKAYGVDIMNVKEIAKADKFTFVPNAASFVRGVYNLRGDIIPIIDLRTFFHVPRDNKEDALENMLILRINDQVYGTIVDKIDKVVGINRETVQPPHPIFGDINIKFISGVVEKQGQLYVILDVIRIFGINKEEKEREKERIGVGEAGDYFVPSAVSAEIPQDYQSADSAIGFIKEGLQALKRFSTSPLNDIWLKKRYAAWSIGRSGENLQLKNSSDAEEFLSTFASPCTGEFWDENYAAAVKGILPNFSSANIHVWNIGCGKGVETYSFACILKARYPKGNIKIWANDNDIMTISQAPNMTFDIDEVPEYCREYMVKGNHGHSFSPEIKDSIVFEYHDVLNESTLPDLDIILARDILSYFPESDQEKLTLLFAEKLKNQGLVITGRNEKLPAEEGWVHASDDPISAFIRTA